MTFICFLKGCDWCEATPIKIGREVLLCQSCSRCNTSRYLAESALT
ncbi:PSPA7_2676 family Cys-rich small protein [Pseudomonas sp. SO81]|jgi:hypothetical protein|nr:PSPA7_2676 family Cys-rich small protein [Pseudomonas sp. SO81]